MVGLNRLPYKERRAVRRRLAVEKTTNQNHIALDLREDKSTKKKKRNKRFDKEDSQLDEE